MSRHYLCLGIARQWLMNQRSRSKQLHSCCLACMWVDMFLMSFVVVVELVMYGCFTCFNEVA